MEQFRKYLIGTRNYIINVLQVFGDSPDNETQTFTVHVLKSNLELVNDIIHHFDELVKEEKDG